MSDLKRIVMGMYGGEPCRICGETIVESDFPDLVFAGYSEGSKSRAAHGVCWQTRPPKHRWAYPEDADE